MILIRCVSLIWYTYSKFQHVRAHNSRVAMSVDFYDLVTSGVNATAAEKSLRNRCLVPGLYAEHLEQWMRYFPSNQVHIDYCTYFR